MACPCCIVSCPCPLEALPPIPIFAPDVTVEIVDAPFGNFTGTYAVPWQGNTPGGWFRWSAQPLSGDQFLTINVLLEDQTSRFPPLRCGESVRRNDADLGPPCSYIATVRVVAFAGGGSFLGVNNTGGMGQGGTVVGCVLPCGDVFEVYEVTHPNATATLSMSLRVSVPVSIGNPLP